MGHTSHSQWEEWVKSCFERQKLLFGINQPELDSTRRTTKRKQGGGGGGGLVCLVFCAIIIESSTTVNDSLFLCSLYAALAVAMKDLFFFCFVYPQLLTHTHTHLFAPAKRERERVAVAERGEGGGKNNGFNETTPLIKSARLLPVRVFYLPLPRPLCFVCVCDLVLFDLSLLWGPSASPSSPSSSPSAAWNRLRRIHRLSLYLLILWAAAAVSPPQLLHVLLHNTTQHITSLDDPIPFLFEN